MKDLIEKILKYLPQYFLDLGRVFSGPKRFIAARDVESDDVFTEACLFFGISLCLLAIVGAQHKPSDMDLWSYIGINFIFALISTALLALIACISLWIVGGKASAKAIFVVYLYFYGTMLIIGRVFDALCAGVLKAGDRSLYDAFMASTRTGVLPVQELAKDTTGRTALVIIFVAHSFSLVWAIIAWGAVTKLNRIGRLRSAVAFVMICASGPLLGWALRNILTGLL